MPTRLIVIALLAGFALLVFVTQHQAGATARIEGNPPLAPDHRPTDLVARPLPGGQPHPRTCSYHPFKWNARTAEAILQERVTRDYDALQPNEIDPATACTVCEEDQETIHLPPLAPFQICSRLANQVRTALTELLAAGEPIYRVAGYRVGRTRGDLDSAGFRTEFSSHSYGIALDVNPEQNGFYHDCVAFGAHCRLMQGGPWIPGDSGTLTADSPIVLAFKEAGFRWGGEIAGTQKDFMHFSPTGY